MFKFVFIFISFSLTTFSIEDQEEIFVIKAKRISEKTNDDQSVDTLGIDLQNISQDLGLPTYQSGAFSGVTSLRPKGLPSGSTKVLFEDLELFDISSISNEFQLQHIASESLGGIEFHHGNFNSEYGTNSDGGVLSLTLPRRNQASLLYGNQNTLNTNLNFHAKKYTFSLNYFSTDGISQINDPNQTQLENDPSQKVQFTGILKEQVGNTHFKIKYLGINHRFDVDNSFLGDIKDNDTNYYYQNTLGIDISKGKLISKTTFNNTQYIDSLQNQILKGKRLKTDINYHLFGDQLLIGIDAEDSFLDVSPGNFNQPIKDKSLLGVGAYFKSKYTSQLVDISTNARLQHNKSFENAFTYGAGVKFKQSKSLDFNFNYHQGFRNPSLFQLFSSFGNPNLAPEKIKNLESGINFKHRFHQLSFLTHLIKYQNQIAYNNNLQKYFNFSKSLYRGLSAKYKLMRPSFGFDLRYDYTHAVDDTGKQLFRVPFNQMISSVMLHSHQLKLKLNFIYKGSRVDFTGSRLNSYTLLHSLINYEFKKNRLVGFNIHNILDKKYEEVENYLTRGRSFYAKFTLLF